VKRGFSLRALEGISQIPIVMVSPTPSPFNSSGVMRATRSEQVTRLSLDQLKRT